MNVVLLIMQILAVLPTLITQAETLMPASGTGADKAAVVLAGVTPMIPDALAPKVIPQVKAYINALVTMYNVIHPLFKKTDAAGVGASINTALSPSGSSIA